MKFIKFLMPLGMAASAVYFAHVFLGQMLWPEYNPVTTDISSLTADGAPHAGLLRIFTSVYGVCFLLFSLGMVFKSFREYHAVTKTGYTLFSIMAFISVAGYALFPLTEDKTAMNFQNTMHIAVTVAVVFTTIFSLFFIAAGYIKKEQLVPLGRICFAAAVMITLTGALNPIGMAQGWNITGLTERLVIFTLQVFVFFLSFVYSFNITRFTRAGTSPAENNPDFQIKL